MTHLPISVKVTATGSKITQIPVKLLWRIYVKSISIKTKWYTTQPYWRVTAFSALLALCEENPPVTGGFPSQRPVTWSFDVFFLICAWTNGWASNRDVDLRRHHAHYNVTVIAILMMQIYCTELYFMNLTVIKLTSTDRRGRSSIQVYWKYREKLN